MLAINSALDFTRSLITAAHFVAVFYEEAVLCINDAVWFPGIRALNVCGAVAVSFGRCGVDEEDVD